MYSFVFSYYSIACGIAFVGSDFYDYYANAEVQCKKVRVGCYII